MRLRALQLQGVRLGHLLVAQIAARTLAATALLLAICVAGALTISTVTFDFAGYAALLKWSGVVLLYSMFWATVAIAICAICGNRISAAFAGFGAWIVLAILIPGAISVVIRFQSPMPQRESYVQAMRDAADLVAANKLDSLARFYDSHPEWRPATALDKLASSVSRLQRAQELERVMASVDQQFEQARQDQQRRFEKWRVLSPVALAYQALVHIAGNDSDRHQRFLREVQQHQQRLRDYFQRTIQVSALGDERSPCPATCLGGYGFRDFDRVPTFAASSGLSTSSGTRTHLIPLLLWMTGLMGLAGLLLARPWLNGKQQRIGADTRQGLHF